MLPRNAAERPQGVLQALGQGDEAFAAEHDMGMLKAGERQPEVVEAVIERLTSNDNAERACIGKSDRPRRPGSCSWRKITSCSGPLSARQALMRRSSVRQMLGLRSGCRRRSSSSTPITRMPGAAFRIGTISASQ